MTTRNIINHSSNYFAFGNFKNDIKLLQSTQEDLKQKMEGLYTTTKDLQDCLEKNENEEIFDKVKVLDATMIKLQKSFDNIKNSHSSMILSFKDELNSVKDDLKKIKNLNPIPFSGVTKEDYQNDKVALQNSIIELRDYNTSLQARTGELEKTFTEKMQCMETAIKTLEDSNLDIKKVLAHIMSSHELEKESNDL